MDISQIAPFAVFAAFSVGAYALISMLAGDKSRVAERLEELRDPGKRKKGLQDIDEDGVKGMFKKAAHKLSKALKPKSELDASALKVRLANAGFSSPNAPTFFLAIKFAGLLVGLLAGGGFGAAKYGLTQNGMFSIVIGGGLGFYLSELALTLIRSGRMERIFLGLPDALDLLVVCVESGLGLDAAMRKVAEEMNDSNPDVCAEFHICNMQLQMGRPRREVLHDLGVRHVRSDRLRVTHGQDPRIGLLFLEGNFPRGPPILL